jgi:hypothetical protein
MVRLSLYIQLAVVTHFCALFSGCSFENKSTGRSGTQLLKEMGMNHDVWPISLLVNYIFIRCIIDLQTGHEMYRLYF